MLIIKSITLSKLLSSMNHIHWAFIMYQILCYWLYMPLSYLMVITIFQVYIIITPILQMKKLSLRTRELAQSHTASEGECQ